jgi:hypothetical protein
MNEHDAEFGARRLLSKVAQPSLPVVLKPYLDHIGAVLKPQDDLSPDEPGFSFQHKGKWYIAVNAKDSEERQRFTVCHEIAHIELGIPSDHAEQPSWSLVKRTPNEMYCDIFASELLLPVALFKPLVEQQTLSFERLDELGRSCVASVSTIGSRAAALSSGLCAFVFSERGLIRYASRSTSLRARNAWIAPRTGIPAGTPSALARAGEPLDSPEEVESDLWLSDWDQGGTAIEEARHLQQWDQTLTLLRFEDDQEEELFPTRIAREQGEAALQELDGVLPWPTNRRRK